MKERQIYASNDLETWSPIATTTKSARAALRALRLCHFAVYYRINGVIYAAMRDPRTGRFGEHAIYDTSGINTL